MKGSPAAQTASRFSVHADADLQLLGAGAPSDHALMGAHPLAPFSL
jgi:hypothetical protein